MCVASAAILLAPAPGVSRRLAAAGAILLPVSGARHASAQAFQDRLPGALIGEQPARSSDDVFVQILARRRHQDTVVIPAVPEPLVVWIVSGAAVVEERAPGGAWQANRVVAGDFFLTTATTPTEMRWRAGGADPFEVMHLYIGVNLLKLAVRDILGQPDARFALREVSGERDDLLSSMLAQIRVELLAGPAPSGVFIQGLAQALTVHLARTYRSDVPAAMAAHGGLQAYKLHRVWAAMQQRLHEPFVLADLAALAQLSPFHFSRVFKQSTGMAPSRYFIALRMDQARQLLDLGDRSIIDVGLAVGYASPGHFAARFKAATGLTPSEYRATQASRERSAAV